MIFERVIGNIHGLDRAVANPTFTAELDWFDCYSRAARITLASGTRAGILLPLGEHCRDGDLLVTATHATPILLVRVRPTPVLIASINDARMMGLACAELGNHHLPLEICAGHIATIDDGLARQVFRELAIPVEPATRVFQPTRSSAVSVKGSRSS